MPVYILAYINVYMKNKLFLTLIFLDSNLKYYTLGVYAEIKKIVRSSYFLKLNIIESFNAVNTNNTLLQNL